MRLFLTKGFIISLIGFFASPVFGKPESSPSHSFLQIFYKFFGNNSNKQDSCVDCLFLHDSEKRDPSTEDILQQCALDLCGPPNSLANLPGFLDSIFNVDKNNSYRIWEDDPPIKRIRENLKPWVARTMKTMNRLQRTLQTHDNKLKSSRNNLTAKDYEDLSHRFFNSFVQVDIDRSRSLSDRLSIQVEIPEDASPELKEGIISYFQDRKRDLNTSLSTQIENDMYNPQEADRILRKKWKDFQGRLRDFLERYEREEISLRSEDLYELEQMEKDSMEFQTEQLKGKQFPQLTNPEKPVPSVSLNDENFLWEIRVPVRNLENMEETLAEIQANSQSEKPNQTAICQNFACRKAIREKLDNTLAFYEKPSSVIEKQLMDRASAHCLSAFILFKEQRKQMEAEGLNIPRSKNNFLKRILSRFSSSTKERFEDFITTNLKIALPLPTDPLERLTTENEEPSVISFFSKDIIERIEEIDYVALINDMDSIKSYLNEGASPCLSELTLDMFSPISETSSTKPFTSRKEAVISLSLFSCLNPHHGRGIAAHEMGHLLSWMFSQNKLSDKSYDSYKKLRACASKRYKNPKAIDKNSPYPIRHTNDTVKTEEDTADLIAHMAVPADNPLFSCSLISITKDGTQYTLDTDILEQENTHSTGLIRILFEAIHKQVKLSSACQKVVDKYKNQINFEPCF